MSTLGYHQHIIQLFHDGGFHILYISSSLPTVATQRWKVNDDMLTLVPQTVTGL
jgi:hypothetical protein